MCRPLQPKKYFILRKKDAARIFVEFWKSAEYNNPENRIFETVRSVTTRGKKILRKKKCAVNNNTNRKIPKNQIVPRITTHPKRPRKLCCG